MRVVISIQVHSSGRHISTQIPVRVVADVTHRNILYIEDLAGEGLVRWFNVTKLQLLAATNASCVPSTFSLSNTKGKKRRETTVKSNGTQTS